MNAINLENQHFPVLLNELISIISPFMVAHLLIAHLVKADTQKEFLKMKNNIIALDRDKDALSCIKTTREI